jgi:acetolactate synthase-1/3 small subunit
VVITLLEDDLLALNRAVGIIRRRNLAVASMSLGASQPAGLTRLVCVVTCDPAAAERMAGQLRKMVGVREVTVMPEGECLTREHALIRVRAAPAQLAALLDVAGLYQAAVVEEGPRELILEATATPVFLGSFLRALEPFGVLEVVRGGTLALGRSGEAAVAAPAVSPVVDAIPA